MEERRDVLARTRSRIFSVKNHKGKSWGDIFEKCDKDHSGFLEYNELECAVRQSLGIRDNVIRDYELKTLFEEVDCDHSGGISIEELLDYVQQGWKTPQQVEAKKQLRIQRAKKSFKQALQALSGNDMQLRKLFLKLDVDGDCSLSLYEFTDFVRNKLNLNFWTVNNTDIVEFFKYVDTNGNGSISIEELVAVVKSNHTDRQKDFSFLPAVPQKSQSLSPNRGGCRMKTFKQRLLEDSVGTCASLRSVSLPNLSRLPYTSTVVGLGRTAAPAGRNSLRKSAQLFFNNGASLPHLQASSSRR